MREHPAVGRDYRRVQDRTKPPDHGPPSRPLHHQVRLRHIVAIFNSILCRYLGWIPTKDSMKGDHALNSGDIPSYLALSEHAIFQCPALVGLGHCPFPVDGP